MPTKGKTEENSNIKKTTGRGGARPGAGKPPFQPTDKERQQVESMSGFGVPYEQIAALIRHGIDDETLVKHFKKELTLGKAKANQQIGQTLFQKAQGGDTTAAIFWAKTQMRWAEHKEVTPPSVEIDGLINALATIAGRLPV